MNISYIIPHFENIEGLEQLLKSLCLVNKDEIIVVDDCSTNLTKQRLLYLQEEYLFDLYFTSENSGAGSARNVGIRKAKNEWLIFADSDDEFVYDYDEVLENYRDSTSQVIYFSPTSKKKSNNKSVRGERHEYYSYLVKEYLKEKTKNNEMILKYNFVVPWSKLINREFIINNGIEFEEVSVSNDILFSAEVANKSVNVEITSQEIYCVVEHEDSMTADLSYDKYMLRLSAYIRYFNFIKENTSTEEFRELNLTGTSFLILAIRSKYSFRQIIDIYKILKQENISILNFKYLIRTMKRI